MLTPCAYHTILGVTVGTDSQLFFLAGSGFTDSFLRGTLWRRSSWNVIEGQGLLSVTKNVEKRFRCSVDHRSDKMNNNHVRILRGLVEESFSTESVFCLRMCTYYFCLAHDLFLP